MIIFQATNDALFCETCKSQIEYLPCREVRIEAENSERKTLHYHYFFPCWDFDYFVHSQPNQRIISSGFLCNKEILEKPSLIRNMENNLELWL